MIPDFLSRTWTAIAPALGNHLWQSTAFAAAAGLLTLTLRKGQARARYWLWLAASVKFLIPFSLLIGIGSNLAWTHGSAAPKAALYLAIEQVGQPFAESVLSPISPTPSSAAPSGVLHLLPSLLVAAWSCGFLVILSAWYVRWRRIAAAIDKAAPLPTGREVEVLRRVERAVSIRKRIEALSSRAPIEPGIFGIVRPILLWPEGISPRLEDAQLEAVLAHEVWHIRRRDNLTAAIHMVVEALFWFHPLVWWMGARLVEERERACDEEVVAMGSERQAYAESILKVCEFCVGSPLVCVSGVTGADLKKRMVSIMTEGIAAKLDFSKKLLLSAALLFALALPIGFGAANATQGRAAAQVEDTPAIPPNFSVSIKASQLSTPSYAGGPVHTGRMMFGPNEFTAANTTLMSIIQEAYGVQASQIEGAPEWTRSEAYDIAVKGEGAAEGPGAISSRDAKNFSLRQAKVRGMLQAVLANNFKLALHRETRDLPSYALVVAEDGPKLQPVKAGDGNEGYGNEVRSQDRGIGGGRMMMRIGGNQVVGLGAQGVSTEQLAQLISRQLGSPVVDKTGLTGSYDFNLQWNGVPDGTSHGDEPGPLGSYKAVAPESSVSSLSAALREQLGLELQSQHGPVEVLIIDHAEKPSED